MDRSLDGVWTRLLRTAAVEQALGAAAIVSGAHGAGEVGSTQDLARDLAGIGRPSGTLVVADHQTAGRGRSGRRWDDHAGGGTLAMTVLLDAAAIREVALVPHALGVAVVTACADAAVGARRLRLKWPNDVVHRVAPSAPARKLCGVLVEREQVPAGGGVRDVLLCGVGIDVDLRGRSAADRVCLAELGDAVPDRAALLGALIAGIDGALSELTEAPMRLLERYRQLSDTLGRTVSVEALVPMTLAPAPPARIVGVASGIDRAGRLLVTTDGVTHAILSGTVRDAATDDGPVSAPEGGMR